MTRDEAIKMLKDYANSERYERNDGTAMRFYHIVNMLCRANPDAAGASNERADAEKDAALSDERIIKVAAHCFGMHYADISEYSWIKFARAILAANKEK